MKSQKEIEDRIIEFQESIESLRRKRDDETFMEIFSDEWRNSVSGIIEKQEIVIYILNWVLEKK